MENAARSRPSGAPRTVWLGPPRSSITVCDEDRYRILSKSVRSGRSPVVGGRLVVRYRPSRLIVGWPSGVSRATSAGPSGYPLAARCSRAAQHDDDFIEVPVAREMPRSRASASGVVRSGTTAAPAPPAQSNSAPGCRMACRAGGVREQQPRNERGQSPRDVERGTIADHVEPPGEADLVVRPSSTGSPRPFAGSPVHTRVCLNALAWEGRDRLSEPISL